MGNRRLGKSGIVVSDICMGTMTFGSQADEAVAHRVMDMSLDAGINFFDTAEGYPVPPDIKWVGRTEEIVGRWLKGKNRDAIIIATKVSGPSHVWFKSPCRGGMTSLDPPCTTLPAARAPVRYASHGDPTTHTPLRDARSMQLRPPCTRSPPSRGCGRRSGARRNGARQSQTLRTRRCLHRPRS